MKTHQAKKVLSDLLAQAVAADVRGDVVQRGSHLRTVEDLPLPMAYVRSAVKHHGLLSVYRGAK